MSSAADRNRLVALRSRGLRWLTRGRDVVVSDRPFAETKKRMATNCALPEPE